MQVVVTKPIARWQIWLGKWLGIMALNLCLGGLCATAVYFQLLWRARHLPPAQQEVLRNEIFVARSSARETLPDLEPIVEQLLAERVKKETVAAMDRSEVRRILREQVRAQVQVVPPGFSRIWRIDLSRVKDSILNQPLYLRTRFFSADKSASGTFAGIWDVGPPESSRRLRSERLDAPETFHEFVVPAGLLDENGLLTVEFSNPNETALLFPLEDGFEVLYREGGFALNYARGVAILFCWLALLAAIGLAAASFLSFPVAAFLSLGILIVAFSTSTMSTVIEQGTIREVDHETGAVGQANLFDHACVVVFKGLLTWVNLARGFSPVTALSTGRSITWGDLARAVSQIVVLMGGLFAAFGIAVFTRRELATAQGGT